MTFPADAETVHGLLAEESFARRLARRFHDVYEGAAPMFGYRTRTETAVPWDEVPEENRRLMEYVCSVIEAEFIAHVTTSMEQLVAEAKAQVAA